MYRNFWNGFHICDDDDGHKNKSTKLVLLSFHFFIAKAKKKLFLMHFYDFGELYDQHVQNIHK